MSGRAEFTIVRRPLRWDLAPVEALRLVRGDAHPVALIGTWAGDVDVIAAEPSAVRSGPGPLADVFDAPLSAVADGAAFAGGWIGYLGYSAGGEALASAGPRRLPPWWFGWYDNVLVRERSTGEWFFEALWTDARAAALERRFADLVARAAEPVPPAGYQFSPFRLTPGPAGHQEAVARAVEYIRAGDIFQANICLRAEAEFTGDPLDAFCQATTELQPPYAAFIGVSAVPATGSASDAAGSASQTAGSASQTAGSASHTVGSAVDAAGSATGPAGPEAATRADGLTRAAVASLSPELFLRRAGQTVTSKPIKGTARRSEDADEAAVQLAELERSAKNRSENVMIVDLVRNDLSRVCLPGTVTVPDLLGSEPHPGLWHLVSTVEGTLDADVTDGDLLRGSFPPGSVTGAPKVRALEIIDELELAPREAYTGAIGYRSPVAGLELNVAIRTFEFAAGRCWLGAGGGIVADSDPAAEYAECLIKATPLLTAIGARLDVNAATRSDPTDALARLAPRPSAGVFSSLLVTDGRTRGLADHLARLASTVRDLYGKELPAALQTDLAACLASAPTGRLRISVRPVGGPLRATIEVVPLQPASQPPSRITARSAAGAPAIARASVPAGPAAVGPVAASPAGPGPVPAGPAAAPVAVSLRPVTVAGGIGGRKWRDRRLLAELAARAGVAADQQLLITDETGEILETDRGNVFAVIDGVLLTPPVDGRLLPGTTRSAVMRAAHGHGLRVGQKPLTLDELASATEVFITNAVVGVLPVSAIDGCPTAWPPGPVTASLATALNARPQDPNLLPLATPAGPVTPPAPHRIGSVAHRAGSSGPVAHRATTDMALGATGPYRSAARPLVVLIDNYDSFTWNLAHLLVTSGARVEVVRNDEVTVAQVASAGPAGVVISPGPCAPAEAGISVEAVRACAAAGIPLLGICLGHQAIAAAFGAAIIRAPRPVHGQPFEVTHDGCGVFAGLPAAFQATRYHSLIIDEPTLPPELVITARTGPLPMGVRHMTAPVEGVQFHPESILTPEGAVLIRNFVKSTVRSI
jgi:para-aminobenzoate synthetase/4-amino-4-deoxychorismate lyase